MHSMTCIICQLSPNTAPFRHPAVPPSLFPKQAMQKLYITGLERIALVQCSYSEYYHPHACFPTLSPIG